jgi:hypothetical protein
MSARILNVDARNPDGAEGYFLNVAKKAMDSSPAVKGPSSKAGCNAVHVPITTSPDSFETAFLFIALDLRY